MKLLLFLWCFGLTGCAAQLTTDYQPITLIKGLNLYLSNVTMDVGKALMEQANNMKMHTMAYYAKVWGKGRRVVEADIEFDDTLSNTRLIVNAVFGDMKYKCENLSPQQLRDECDSMNANLVDGLSTILIKTEDAKEVHLELECLECLGIIAAIATSSENKDISVNIQESGAGKRRKHLRLGKKHQVMVAPPPERIEAVLGLKSRVEIKKDFIPYHNFRLRLTYPNKKIRYVRDEFLVSDLEVTADPWEELYRLNFGDMLKINITLEIGYNAKFYLFLETGGGLLRATTPSQSISVKQSVTKEVKFIAGPDVNNLPDFGLIKIRTDPGHKLVWQYQFRVDSYNTRDVMGRLVQEGMALGDLDGSDQVDFAQDGKDYEQTTKNRAKFSRRRLSSRKKSDQSESDTDDDEDTYTRDYETSGGSKFSYVFALLYLAHILSM